MAPFLCTVEELRVIGLDFFHAAMLLGILIPNPAAVVAQSSNSGDARSAEKTLCAPHEEIYFSCPSGKKIISVCASGNISPENGYVQYRIGQLGKIDLEYPSKPFSPKGVFTISDISGGDLNIEHLKFKSGTYNYVVYQGDTSGIYVKKAGKTVANLICDEGDYQRISPRAMRGIETTSPIDGVDN